MGGDFLAHQLFWVVLMAGMDQYRCQRCASGNRPGCCQADTNALVVFREPRGLFATADSKGRFMA